MQNLKGSFKIPMFLLMERSKAFETEVSCVSPVLANNTISFFSELCPCDSIDIGEKD